MKFPVASIIYWYIVPLCQYVIALLVAETLQYFCHCWLHSNKWAFKHIHSMHHRLYISYSYGALYTHPLESLFLDTGSATIATYVSGLTIRQSILLYSYMTAKAVIDHSGYVFPWNPILLYTDNDSYFHDIHHQRWGIKHNFGLHLGLWDKIMGTYWSDWDSVKMFNDQNRIAAEEALKGYKPVSCKD